MTLYRARVVLDNLLTPANDIWARDASRGGAWIGTDMSQSLFKGWGSEMALDL